MGTIHSFENEKLIICTMYSDPAFLEKAENMLISEFGPYDLVSADYPFSEDFSAYYDGELGGKAIRRIYSFEQCIDPSRLAAVKTLTNSFENTLSEDGNRRVNLDPGLLNQGGWCWLRRKLRYQDTSVGRHLRRDHAVLCPGLLECPSMDVRRFSEQNSP